MENGLPEMNETQMKQNRTKQMQIWTGQKKMIILSQYLFLHMRDRMQHGRLTDVTSDGKTPRTTT